MRQEPKKKTLVSLDAATRWDFRMLRLDAHIKARCDDACNSSTRKEAKVATEFKFRERHTDQLF